ncbi:23S rRNA (cytidine(2498)-2'-O)-methyltransferase RlmM [Leeia sp.]|uniref:23S rRNA (cytidine(2498)-2'-O)-methyltransferase RlmM n=1 Tax=Leeia sp. TaxID=2884678 RepID=UPI0035AF952A
MRRTVSLSSELPITGLLAYCRAGFEAECGEELLQAGLKIGCQVSVEAEAGSGFVRLCSVRPDRRLQQVQWADLIFARQLLLEVGELTGLPERDRLTPLLTALQGLPLKVGSVWLETADTNEAKELSGFCRRFGDKLAPALRQVGVLVGPEDGVRLVLFWRSHAQVHLALAMPGNRSEWPQGIPRLRMPFEAPSRSTLKLAEAIQVFMSAEEEQQRFKSSMRAVDLGAAPGGWTWQLITRGLKVLAVDNGPLKGNVQGHPQVRHFRQDGFRFRPDQPVDWLVCDMVEQPVRVARLMADWLADGLAREAIFNLKLPMKKRLAEVERCFDEIRERLSGVPHQLEARQLYHDREEITVYLRRLSSRKR